MMFKIMYRFLGVFCSAILFFVFTNCSSDSSGSAAAAFEIPAVEDMVMYEINIKAFSSTKDFKGVTARLDQIKELGVNTIWLMPIYQVGVVNSFGSPYCVKNYKELNSQFGTLADLQELIRKAHEKKIAVILDWVGNHTSWDNDWMSNPSWYTQDGNGNIISPAGTNWNDVADLNFENAAMRVAMIEAMKYWIDTTDIDGFRCDAADFVPFDFWQQAITELNTIPNKHLIMLAEGARNDHFTAGFQMNFSWNFLGSLKNVFTNGQGVATLFATNTNEYSAVPTGKRKLRFTTNHDESNQATPVTVFGSKQAAMAASVVTIYLEGVPLLYCGQEVGVSLSSVYNGSNTINWTVNTDMLEEYKKMMQFYATSNAARKGSLMTFDNPNVVIFQKSSGAERVLVLVNTRAVRKTIGIPLVLQTNWTDVLSNVPKTLSNSLTLAPNEYLILRK